MVKIILTTDETLTSTYRDIPLLDFLGCSPVEKFPKIIYKVLDTQLPHENGILKVAPYSLRKVEASLLKAGFKREEIAVVHPRFINKYLSEDVEIVGISTMDPLGLGPLSMMFSSGGKLTPYSKSCFLKLVKNLDRERGRRNLRFKIVVGGSGAWQLALKSRVLDEVGVDHVVIGEVEHCIGEVLDNIRGGGEKVFKTRGYPRVDEIPSIVAPSYKGMVEVMRGCGRGCQFCEPNLRYARFIPEDKILEEVGVNFKAGIKRAWLHSEDIFLYKFTDHKSFTPNVEAVTGLFKTVLSKYPLEYVNPTHGSLAPIAYQPRMVEELSRIVGAGPERWVGIQVGMETGSSRLIRKYMVNKAKPFSPEEWGEVVLNATYVLNKNYWFPAYTLVMGLPEEDEEDCMETVQLLLSLERVLEDKLGREKTHFTVTPLAFIPLGALKKESFFNVEEEISEAKFLLIYHSWRITLKEVRKSFYNIARGAFNKTIIYPLAVLGSELILHKIRDWGKSLGYDPDKPIGQLSDLKLRAAN